MKIITDKNFIINNSCVTVGKFDGLHLGHRRLLEEMQKYKGINNLVVFTFDNARLFNTLNCDGQHAILSDEPDRLPYDTRDELLPLDEKIRVLEKMGTDYLIIYPFDRETADMSPDGFIRDVLIDRLGIKTFVCGNDFRFGKNAEGNTDTLLKYGADFGFTTVICEDVLYKDRRISSTRIREELLNNHEADAHHMLS